MANIEDVYKELLRQKRELVALNLAMGTVVSKEAKQDTVISELQSIKANQLLSPDYFVEVAKGNIAGAELLYKFGHNKSVGTTLAVISNSGVYQTPTTAKSLEIVSDDAGDNSAGLGARKVLVIGLDASFNEVSVEVTMNGLTAAAIPGTFMRVYRAYIIESGIYGTLTSPSHIGTLTIREAGGGAVWSLINGTDAYPHSQTEIGAFTIPAGKTGYLSNIVLSIDTNKTVDVFMFIRDKADVVSAPFSANRVNTEIRGAEGQRRISLRSLRKYEEKTDIAFYAKTPTGTADIGVEFELILMDN